MEDWVKGKLLSDNPHVTQAVNAKAVGAWQAYEEVLTATEEDMNS